jgi:hypothetical protein
MSRLRAILDRINDVEATISRISREATDESAFAYRLTLESLENRRDELRSELAEATRHEFVEICDYRIIPDKVGSYVLSAVTSALHEFQDIFSIVYDAQTSKPKQRATLDAEVVSKTQFNFGFAYEGSLGVALTIRNDRLLLIESDLDQAIGAVFSLLKATSAESLRQSEALYGRAAIRKLYTWSKAHSDYGMSADIKWVRDSEVRKSVLTQSQEFAEICRMIEAKSDETVLPVTLHGVLASWDTVHRKFILLVPDAEPISGIIGKDVDISRPRTVRGERCEVSLLKHVRIRYTSDKDETYWEVVGIQDETALSS